MQHDKINRNRNRNKEIDIIEYKESLGISCFQGFLAVRRYSFNAIKDDVFCLDTFDS